MVNSIINQNSLIITQKDFEENIKRLVIYPKKAKFVVGVSGGSDSLCLAFMLNIFANQVGAELLAVIVDHKLREESTLEANFVADLLKIHNVKSVILNRENIPIITGIQKKARDERYCLLKNYCKNQGYPYLFIAHHLDDQLETISMREESGENILGNSGMSAKIVSSDVIIIRPFLKYTKQQILNTIKYFTNTWVEDPSNKNTKYTRVQHRLQLNSLDNSAKKVLTEDYHKNAQNRIYLETKLLEILSQCVLINSLGLIKLNLILFNRYDQKIKILVIRKLIKFAESKTYEIKIVKIKNFLLLLEKNSSFKFSLGNCLLKVKKGELAIFKNRIIENQSNINEHWNARFLFCKQNNMEECFIKNITKYIYFEKIKQKPFKKYLESKSIDGDFVWGLPWIFSKNDLFNWDYKNYEIFKYKSNSSLLMNFFTV